MEYDVMFARNIGIFSEKEQKTIRNLTIGVIGCGGMGSITAQIAARTGVESIILADPENYEAVNINNQFSAFEKTIGENKAQITARIVKGINSNIKVTPHKEGLNEKNVTEIVKQSDIIFDCIDYNELFFSYILTNEAKHQKKFVLAPQAIGYGASILIFDPNGISFNEYLGMHEGMSREEVGQIIIPPEKYAPILPDYINEEIISKTIQKRIPIPNIALAQTLAASIMVAEALFILLGKRKPVVVPNIIAIDLLLKKYIYNQY
ncbi:MAG: ThiF family adenylyltransferase [Patescibacteria group bacterium]|nr:ThiF family adenylyltransferase [Patescibacteria group bacterium]MDD5715209.1 ThiF family adenylyltransferase [Patescibacteria group bacterium]